jgi:metallo-beta-lactamase class B
MILLDGDLPQSVPLIEDSIRSLGHDIREVKLILVSHEHFDHVGGVAALQRDSGARVLAGAAAAKALGQGHPTEADPQYDARDKYPYPKVAHVETVEDGQQIRLGEVTVTAHRTPGHTPGGTSYSWKSCEPGKCLDIVYADSLTAFALSDDFRFAPIADTFRASIDRIRNLPCDILVTTHPGMSDFWRKNDKRDFVDPNGCRALADGAEAALDRRLAEEKK